jgi:hypothetical protein
VTDRAIIDSASSAEGWQGQGRGRGGQGPSPLVMRPERLWFPGADASRSLGREVVDDPPLRIVDPGPDLGETTRVSAQGTGTAARTVPRPTKARLIARAIPMPSSRSVRTDTIPSVEITRTALCQRERPSRASTPHRERRWPAALASLHRAQPRGEPQGRGEGALVRDAGPRERSVREL